MSDQPAGRHDLSGEDRERLRDDERAEWNARYGGSDRIWSGNPNSALVDEVGSLAPGRALDVGCGEGADAIWLASRGWQVTALDVSDVAIERASQAARTVGVEVTWLVTGLLDARLPAGGFDLVSACYPVLRRTPNHAAERVLVAAVAPSGTLLVVHHADLDAERATAHGSGGEGASAHGFDPAAYAGPADVAAVLGAGWEVAFDPRRPRTVTSGAGAGHTDDVILHAIRTR